MHAKIAPLGEPSVQEQDAVLRQRSGMYKDKHASPSSQLPTGQWPMTAPESVLPVVARLVT